MFTAPYTFHLITKTTIMKIGLILSAIVGFVVLLVLLSFLFSWPIWMLWNGCLVGAIDGVHQITWMQAWGLSILCSFLFKPSSVSTKSE